MKEAKLFKNGRSQAVRLPKEFRFDSDKVYIRKFEKIVMLIPEDNPWGTFIKSLDKFSDDYMQERKQPKIHKKVNFE